MSAPETNLETQRKRHRVPIIGISAALLFVVVVTLGAFIWPGIPLDQQAAPDGVGTETLDGDAVSGGPSIIVDNQENVIVEETQ